MRIKTLTGHLTARNKSVISQMLAKPLMHARSGRTCYNITQDAERYSVEINYNEANDYGVMKHKTSRHTFMVQGATKEPEPLGDYRCSACQTMQLLGEIHQCPPTKNPPRSAKA